MKFLQATKLFLALPLAAAIFTSCEKDDDPVKPATVSSFAIELDARVPGTPTSPAFTLNTPYTKSDGQTFTATKFKYLLSNVRLLKADGTAYAVPESYYLIDASRPLTSHLIINDVPLGEYTGMSFIIGVDAARNASGAQTGALDPGNDLFWDWAQGYIFVKLEGNSPQAPPSTALIYHIGGTSNIRTVSPSFGTSKLTIVDGHTPEIHMIVNPAALFESTTPANRINFTIATNCNVMAGSLATTIADNYAAGMFTIGHIHAN
jgi:hypothetical protein